MHINPDHFLETSQGRQWTKERNALAWERSYAALDSALALAQPGNRVYLLVGAQGSGKSTWACDCAKREPSAIIFDAILVRAEERAPILAKAVASNVQAVAIWFQTSLSVCLERNASRPIDRVCSEQAVRNVFAALEPPTVSEGFSDVVIVL